jgi:VWFA-related protein
VLLTVLLTAAHGNALAQEETIDPGYRETVRVDLAQIEVTVWPKDGRDTDACLGLGTEDFEVIVNGRQREITAIDWLGSPEIMQTIEETSVVDPENPPLTMVLFFDLWHLNVFFRNYDCPMTKPLAFDEARELVRSQFRDGDRLLLVTFAGWPQIHEGWIRDKTHALRALDRLEVSPFVMGARQQHSHHHSWIAGMKSLFLALGRYPGRKEVFYLGDDFRFDDVVLQVYDLAARAQANQVSIHAVDLLESCRSAPGLGCDRMTRGGLGCTPFKRPIALGYMSVNTGGQMFHRTSSLAQAVQTVRRMRGCRYLISFPVLPRDGKRSPQAKVRLLRKGLRLHFPASFGSPLREPKEREKQDALFLLPRFGEGVHAEVGLWPLRPSGKKKRWKGVMVARLNRAPQDDWPEELEKIEIEAAASLGSRIYKGGRFRKVIEGDELRRLRDGESRLFVFPVDKIKPGRNAVWLRALGVGGEVSANVRSYLEVSDPPGPGEAGPWILVDRLARFGETITVLPALSGLLPEGKGSLLLAYGCRDGNAAFGEGRLVALDGDETVLVPIDWFEAPEEIGNPERECDWLAGGIEPMLGPGLWQFEPPAALSAEDESPYTVEFRVTPGN